MRSRIIKCINCRAIIPDDRYHWYSNKDIKLIKVIDNKWVIYVKPLYCKRCMREFGLVYAKTNKGI